MQAPPRRAALSIHAFAERRRLDDPQIVGRARRAGEAMAVAAACLATAISPTLGSHRSAMLCLTTGSRAPLQDPKCGGDRQTDEMRSVSQAGRKLRLCRQFCPKPTYSNVAGQVAFIGPRLGPRRRIRLAHARMLGQARVEGVASGISPNPALLLSRLRGSAARAR